MKIAIIDYSNSVVIITKIPHFDNNDDIESYIAEKLGFKIEDIAWMTSDKISVSIEV